MSNIIQVRIAAMQHLQCSLAHTATGIKRARQLKFFGQRQFLLKRED